MSFNRLRGGSARDCPCMRRPIQTCGAPSPGRTLARSLVPSCNTNNIPCCRRDPTVPFAFFAVDANTGEGLPGAVWALVHCGRRIQKRTSDALGAVRFAAVPPGRYTLEEISPPLGYEAAQSTFTMVADCFDNVYINGAPASVFRAYHTPVIFTPDFDASAGSTPACGVSFKIVALDAAAGARLPGVSFALLNGGNVVATAVSGPSGKAKFDGIAEGSYRLAVTSVPAGYAQVTESFVVCVAGNGSVTINGCEASAFPIPILPAA